MSDRLPVHAVEQSPELGVLCTPYGGLVACIHCTSSSTITRRGVEDSVMKNWVRTSPGCSQNKESTLCRRGGRRLSLSG